MSVTENWPTAKNANAAQSGTYLLLFDGHHDRLQILRRVLVAQLRLQVCQPVVKVIAALGEEMLAVGFKQLLTLDLGHLLEVIPGMVKIDKALIDDLCHFRFLFHQLITMLLGKNNLRWFERQSDNKKISVEVTGYKKSKSMGIHVHFPCEGLVIKHRLI